MKSFITINITLNSSGTVSVSFLVSVKLHNLSFIRDDEGNELTDSLLRANLFNDHFTNIHKTVTLTQPVSANNHLPLC